MNTNHTLAIQFTTLAHELGHLFLGHFGEDRIHRVPKRPFGSHTQIELEAESVAYIVCSRNGVQSRSQTYLAKYVSANTTVDQIDVYQVLRAAGQVESMLGVSAHPRSERRGGRRRGR
jgi:antirestriction protein ArdC